MADAVAAGYAADDLDWLRDQIGVAHLELDPWGSLIVTPATDEHEIAVAVLHSQAVRHLDLPEGCVLSNGLAWKVPGGSGYLNVPDLAVMPPGWRRLPNQHLDLSPLLVVEVASPSTRAVDRGRKASDYRLGGAELYLLVDLPLPGSAGFASFEALRFATDEVTSDVGILDLVIDGRRLRFDLSQLPASTRPRGEA